MPQGHILSGPRTRLRSLTAAGLVLGLLACGESEAFDPASSIAAEATGAVDEEVAVEEPITVAAVPTLASASFAGGIPFGTFSQPTSEFGSVYNGAHRIIFPQYLARELSAIKSRGGKVVLKMAGGDKYVKDAAGNFSLTKWKSQIDKYKSVNFGSYVTDGTIVGHYLIDEPNDPSNWNGKPISPSTLEEMARYSKQLWPNMATIVRADPSYLSSNHRYLDAAWAQYVHRKGPASDYIRRTVSEAQKKGLSLVIGLNILKGGVNGSKMSASQVKEWGSTLLSSSYPCAFISWKYNDSYLSGSGVREAMSALRNKAESRSTKNCKS